ncbi:hypothetical protein [Aeromicrobium sp. UC242_57]
MNVSPAVKDAIFGSTPTRSSARAAISIVVTARSAACGGGWVTS